MQVIILVVEAGYIFLLSFFLYTTSPVSVLTIYTASLYILSVFGSKSYTSSSFSAKAVTESEHNSIAPQSRADAKRNIFFIIYSVPFHRRFLNMFSIIVSHIAEKEKTFLLVNILFCVFSLSAFLFCVKIE